MGVSACSGLYKIQSDLYSQLKQKYDSEYQMTIFHQTCLRALKQYRQYNPQIRSQQDFPESQSLKRSLIDSNYLQNSESIIETKDSKSRFSMMNENEKRNKVIQLIRDSYILLDLTDIFQGEDLEVYEKQIKKQIFKNEQSFIKQSFMMPFNTNFETNLSQSLKRFNSDAVIQLESYIQLCKLIKKDSYYSPQDGQTSQKFISFLLRELISKLIVYCRNSQEQQEMDHIFVYVRTLINIIEDTVCILYKLRIKDNQMSMSFSQLAEDSKDQSYQPNIGMNQEQGQIVSLQFLNKGNFYTLISSIIFSSTALTDFLHETMKKKFQKHLKEYKQKANYQNSDLIKMLKRQKFGESKIRTNVQSLFGSSKQDKYNLPDSLFGNSIKYLNKISKKKQPILILKIAAQMERQIFKQFAKLQAQLQLDLLYDRTTLKIISCWLLNRQKNKNIDNMLSLILTYAFIDRQYRISKKGSSIVCFIQQIERIFNWKVQTQ